MSLFNAILLNQPTQYVVVFNILTDIILLFLVYLKFCSNMSSTLIHYIKQYNHFVKLSLGCFITCIVFNTTCSIDIKQFQCYFQNCYSMLFTQSNVFKTTHFWVRQLLWQMYKIFGCPITFFFPNTYLTYFSGMFFSTVLKRVKFILSLFFSIFKYRIFMFFLFLTYFIQYCTKIVLL